jgi:hypothetical protein
LPAPQACRRRIATAYSVIAVGGRRSRASRCALPHSVLEHFSLNQLCQLDATAWQTTPCGSCHRAHVLAWRMSISSQAGAAISRDFTLGDEEPFKSDPGMLCDDHGGDRPRLPRYTEAMRHRRSRLAPPHRYREGRRGVERGVEPLGRESGHYGRSRRPRLTRHGLRRDREHRSTTKSGSPQMWNAGCQRQSPWMPRGDAAQQGC